MLPSFIILKLFMFDSELTFLKQPLRHLFDNLKFYIIFPTKHK